MALDPASAVAAPAPTAGTGPAPTRRRPPREHFGRIFRLAPFARQTPKVEAALRELGRPGGLLDAADPLAAGPKALIVDLSLSANNPNNPSHTAGTTFLGQFLDHDVTFDAASRLAPATNPADARNFRTPALDLDSVYGAGPVAQQELYDPADHIKLKVESGGVFEDLPRRADGAAIVGDPRNDEHLIISGLHCAFLLFHNHAVDHVRAQGQLTDTMDVFAEARRLTTWHYQWLIVHEFLPQIVGQAMVDDVLRHGRRFYRPRRGEAFMPVEFQTGTYRMGHSMVRPVVPREPRRRQRTAVLRLHLRPVAGGQGRPRRPARRGARRAPVHRLADLLRLRRRRGQAEQEDRHEDLDGAVHPAAGRHRDARRPDRAAPAQPAAPPDLAASLGPERRSRDGRHAARSRPTCRSWRRWASASSAARRCGTTS